MAEKRRRLSPEARREEILQAAKHLFATKGYGETKMIDIAREIKASRSIFEPYFENKEAIYEALFARWEEELEKPVPFRPVEEIGSTVDCLAAIMARLLADPAVIDRKAGRDLELRAAIFSREGSKNKITEALTRHENKGIADIALPLIVEGQKRGEIRQGDTVSLYKAFFMMFFGAGMYGQYYGDTLTKEDIVQIMELFRP